MKKIMIAMAIILASTIAAASGKITIQPMYNTTMEKNLTPQIGLSIYEKFPMNVAYVGWIGTGEPLIQTAEKDDLRWFTMKHSLEAYVNKFTIAPGVQYVWNGEDGVKKKNEIFFLKVSYQLW